MKDVLPLLVNYKNRFESFVVETNDTKEKYFGSDDTYDATVTTLYGITKSKQKIELKRIHTGYMSLWDDKQTQILKDITEPLNDFTQYRWGDIKRPLMRYWKTKRKDHIAKQESLGISNPSKLGGDSTLWRWGMFMSSVLVAKYHLLGSDTLPKFKDTKDKFLSDFDTLVLGPLYLFVKLEKIHEDESNLDSRTIKIVDEIVSFSKKQIGGYDNLLDPSYRSNENFLDSSQERELDALYTLYDDVKKDIESDRSLEEIEKRVRMLDFLNSYQGKRFSTLKSMKVYGGNMSFQDKEEAKRERVEEIARDFYTVLASWGNEYKEINQGIQHYQKLYEMEVYKRQRLDDRHRKILESSEENLQEYSTILKGLWNSDHLNFIGIMIGVIVTFGLTFGTLVSSHQWLVGIGSSFIALIVFVCLFKFSWSRKKLSKFSRWVLSPEKEKKKN